MDGLERFLTSPLLTAAGTVASLVGVLISIVSMLGYLQRRTVTADQQLAENSYLKGFIEYIHQLHFYSSFNERFFIERQYKLQDKYEVRSFFMTKHRAMVPRLGRAISSSPEAQKKQSDGYFTTDIFREATSRNEPLIILGDPGSGKSVSARQLALAVANRTLRSRRPYGRIPVFISLSEYVGNEESGEPMDFYRFLTTQLMRRVKSGAFPSTFLVEHLDYYLDSGRLFVILDSLDEMPPASFSKRCQAIMDFMVQHGTNTFVLTCRSNDFGGNIKAREAYLDRLTPKEIKRFIKKRSALLGDWKPSVVRKHITAPGFALNSVVDNPFYLNLILFFLSVTGELPGNLPLLFQIVCKDWADRESKKKAASDQSGVFASSDDLTKSKSDLEQVLAYVAFAISNSAGFGTSIRPSELERSCAQYGITAEQVRYTIEVSVKGGMLDESVPESGVRFIHHKFQEYFAAEFLNRSLKEHWIDFQDVPSICRNIWWEEVTALLVSITDEPENIINVLLEDALTMRGGPPNILQRNFFLIGRALHLLPDERPSKQSLVDRVIETIDETLAYNAGLPSTLDCLRGLGQIDDQRAVVMLSKHLRNSSPIVRGIAMSQLGTFARGRQFLAESVYRIALGIYVKGDYGGHASHLRTVRSLAFSSLYSRFVLTSFAVFSVVFLQGYKIIFTLAVVLAAPSLFLANAYCLFLVALGIVRDFMVYYLLGRPLPLKIALRELGTRAVFLTVLGLFSFMGMFSPPYWSAVSLIGVYLGAKTIERGIALFVSLPKLSRKARQKLRRGSFRVSFVRIPKTLTNALRSSLIKRFSPVSFDISTEKARTLALTVGYLNPETYVRTFTSSPQDLVYFLERLEDADFNGFEIELFQAIQNAHRRFLQDEVPPNITLKIK